MKKAIVKICIIIIIIISYCVGETMFLKELESTMYGIRAAEKSLSLEELKKEREKTAEIVAQLVDLTINGGTLTSTDTVYNMSLYSYSFRSTTSPLSMPLNLQSLRAPVPWCHGHER